MWMVNIKYSANSVWLILPAGTKIFDKAAKLLPVEVTLKNMTSEWPDLIINFLYQIQGDCMQLITVKFCMF